LEDFQARLNEMQSMVEETYSKLPVSIPTDIDRCKKELPEANEDRKKELKEIIDELEPLRLINKKDLDYARKIHYKSMKDYEKEKKSLIEKRNNLS
jgi:hypothetical protein